MIFSKSGSYVVTLVKLVLLAAVLVQAEPSSEFRKCRQIFEGNCVVRLFFQTQGWEQSFHDFYR